MECHHWNITKNTPREIIMISIKLVSLPVNDQEKALQFYTETLGFLKQQDIPMGEFRWLTVTSPASDEIELVLEPMGFDAAKTYYRSLYDAGIPVTAFATDDIEQEFERLLKHGVKFKSPPTKMGPVTIAVFDDTCGNLIQLFEVGPAE
jgi:predicted enzyme related to lactoylglutathione lyase